MTDFEQISYAKTVYGQDEIDAVVECLSKSTQMGHYSSKFEAKIATLFQKKHCLFVNSGSSALFIGVEAFAFPKNSEVITPALTFSTSVGCLVKNNLIPVFVDVDPLSYCINVNQIEGQITDKTVAIMPVHVFGNPCDVEAIEAIAKKHSLKVIYDAAHAIGSTYKNKSLLEYGDISATSLHATKLLNTAEGGGCITTSSELNEKLKRIRFFGHNDVKNIVEEGFNGKLTEVNAALGIANLKYYDEVLQDRKNKYFIFKNALEKLGFLKFQSLKLGEPNYSYFPIIFDSELRLLELESELIKQKIYPRRYFYPAVNTLNNIVVYDEMPIAENIAKRILCLPLYWTLKEDEMKLIIDIISQK